MCNSLKLLLVTLIALLGGCIESGSPLQANTKEPLNSPSRFEIGSKATQQLIDGWNIDIATDGSGLPVGSGSVSEGEELYDNLCAACHGTFGEGEEQWPKLTGGESSLTDQRPLKTIGSYWPYSTTLWDYINRAMPFPAPQSLEVNQVYAITAYVLNMNEIVEDNFILNNRNLASIKMPNAQGFFLDNRPDTTNTRCMKNCKKTQSIKIISGPVYEKTELSSAIDSAPRQAQVNSLAKEQDGEAIYLAGCNLCHDNGLVEAPKIGVAEDWSERQLKDIDSIYKSVINGIGNMPAKGGRTDLSNNSIKQAVDYMLKSLE